jgi:7,8-dihydropterin-6-yl-methyl-4-(beta-D-ribofuranosyl)aminobenzene 5'-phosphate synthase
MGRRKGKVKIKVTIIYDNTAYSEDLEADWGFSCLVEVENTPVILFDTGTKGGILLRNMRKLGIEPESIDEVFISHAHFDHTGGLSHFLKVNKDVKVYVPISFHKPLAAKEVVSVKEPLRIQENIFSTGELSRIEQSLVVKTERGSVVVAGCSHPGVGAILKVALQFGKVYALIGGLHGFREFDKVKGLGLICPTHCTQYKSEIESIYPEIFTEGGAGRIIAI